VHRIDRRYDGFPFSGHGAAPGFPARRAEAKGGGGEGCRHCQASRGANGRRQIALRVDAIRNTEEIAIKPLNRRFKSIALYSGAAVLGDARSRDKWATSSEMSRNISEAAKVAGKVAQNIQGVAQAAQSTSQGATDSQKAAKSLTEMATQLQALVGRFKLSTGGRSALTARAGKTNRNSGRAKKAEKFEELAVR